MSYVFVKCLTFLFLFVSLVFSFQAILGTWAGFTFFEPLTGPPQIFLKTVNQGGLDDYKYNRK